MIVGTKHRIHKPVAARSMIEVGLLISSCQGVAMPSRIRTTANIIMNICLLPVYLGVAFVVIGFGLPIVAIVWLVTFLFGE